MYYSIIHGSINIDGSGINFQWCSHDVNTDRVVIQNPNTVMKRSRRSKRKWNTFWMDTDAYNHFILFNM